MNHRNPKNKLNFPEHHVFRNTSLAAVLHLFLFCFSCLAVAAQLVREANTTLRLPAEPVSANGEIILTEAFPGLLFDGPVCIRSIPGETNRLFIVERSGRIMVINDLSDPIPDVFLDIRDHVFASDWINDRRTEGLTSFAFHPKFNENGRFFVSYSFRTETESGWDYYNRISEFQANTNRTAALPDSEIPYVTQFDEGDGHNINDLHFGPDNYLYIATGDEGDGNTGGDEYNNAQRIDKDYFSAIMRIDVDKRPGNLLPNPHPSNTTNYWVPSDNPFVGVTSFLGKTVDTNNVRTEFWAVGLRNPWRISFDPVTGSIYEGDVGQHGREEINRIVKGGNYGWSFKEGTQNGPKAPAPGFAFIDPLFQYGTGWGTNEGFSVTGGVVYRSLRIPSLYGHLIFADYVSGNIWALNIDQDPPPQPKWLLNFKGISTFAYDPRNGDILLAFHNEETPGKIYRLDISGGSSETYPQTLADTGIFSDLQTLKPNRGIVPFDVNLPFWSDGAIKTRWFSIPDLTNRITFSAEQNWTFPPGTLWIKHFDLELHPGDLTSAKRVETRVLVKSTVGIGLYGLSYMWDDDGLNATLVPEAGDKKVFTISSATSTNEQTWIFPSRTECLFCHTTVGGLALGFNTAQLNKAHNYGTNATNQISALAAAGYFANPPSHLNGLRALAASDDTSTNRTYRVRSYLAANCSFCHQPGGSSLAAWDARASTPLSLAHIVNGTLYNNLGNTTNRVVVAGSTNHSALFTRISSATQRMPPIASTLLDQQAIDLLAAWITEDLPEYEQLYETWSARVFAQSNEDSSPDADPDGDGLNNYEEYLAGTNPLSKTSRYTVTTEITNGKILISAAQPLGRALLFESTGSLQTPAWGFLNSPSNNITFLSNSVTRSVLDVMDASQKFYRVRLIEP